VVRGEVENLLTARQFQDRVSQILSGMDNNVELMWQTLADADTLPLPDANDWLEAMNQASYMKDQIYQPTGR